MKQVIPLLLTFSLACCGKRESMPAAQAAKPSKAPVVAAVPPDSWANSFVLDTPRIRIRKGYQADILAPIADANAILKDIGSLPKSATRDHAIGTVIEKVAELDPAAARQLLLDWTDGLARVWADTAEKVGIAIAKTDPGGLAAFISNEVPETMRSGVWSQSLNHIPPAERLAYLEHVVESQDKLVMMADMMAAWLPQDPKAVAAWLDQFAIGRNAEEIAILAKPGLYLDAAGKPIPGSRTEDWLAALRSATNPEARAFLARQVLASSGGAPDAALLAELATAESSVANLARDKAIQHDAAAFAANLSPQEIAGLTPEVADNLIGEWSKKQPRRALDWAMEHGRPEAATALMALYYQEPGESIVLAPTLATGKERDATIRSICALEASNGKAETARTLLTLISDPERREAVRQNVERHLARSPESPSR